jgi:hypothetical protein
MFGNYVESALTIGVAVLSAAILQFIIPYLLPFQGPSDSMLYRAFDGIAENALLIMLVAIAAGVLARAVVESRGVR